ncbi:hypothetical protein MMC27_000338 [Xylographa pallens]|nr:hypothetical protein [Xylographa pallens]
MLSSTSQLLILAAALGFGSHLLFFRVGEHHKSGLLYFQLVVAAVPALLPVTVLLTHASLLQTSKVLFQTECVFLLSLSFSITLYRFSPYHRLAAFPGPWMWRWTKLAQTFANRHSRGFETLDRLHQRYGEYVRIGPTELSVIDPDVVDAILGSASRCTKSPWYDINPLRSILTIRDKTEHRTIRKAYEHGLREQALEQYESRIIHSLTEFASLVKSRGPEPIDVSYWTKLLVVDINDQFSFSKKPICLKDGKLPAGLENLEDGFYFLGTLGPVPWLFILLLDIPFVRKEFNRGADFCRDLVADRLKEPQAGPDILGSIISAAPRAKSDEELAFNLRGEANVLVIAGTDSITSTLVFCLYQIARHPHHAKMLRKELEEMRQKYGNTDAKTLRTHGSHLNGVVYETLRLHPAVPSGAVRATPPGGVFINKRYVPEGVTVCIPQWTLMRSPKCFVCPAEFIPERWTSQPELILQRDAWIPFHIGTHGCVGRQLALMVLRLSIANLVRRFDIVFGPNENGEGLLRDSKDHFNWSLAPLNLQFTERANVDE